MRPEDILALYSLNSLRTIARMRAAASDRSWTALRRPELITMLAQQLFDLDILSRMIAALSPGERAALTALIESGGRLSSAELAQQLLNAGVIDSAGPIRARETIDRIPATTRRFDELCARLTAYGLIFSEPHQAGTLSGPYDLAPGPVLFVPGPVLELVRQPPATPPEPAPPPAPAPVTPRRDSAAGRLLVQPSYSVLALPPLDEPTLARLSSFAETIKLAEVGEFKLTQPALFAAVERGADVAALIRFLEERSGAALPQNVRYTLNDWAKAFVQVRLYREAAVLEAEPALLDRLEADATIAPLVVRRLAPGRLLLNNAAAVERALVALDELPQLIDYAATAQRVRFTLAADDTITPDANDLLLPLALRRIAEPRADGRFQLSPERVRAAVADAPDGLTGLLKWLRENGGPLSTEMVSRLRVWTLSRDAVALEQPLLLRLPADLLADLRTQPELAPLLADEYQPDAALVRVSPQHRPHLLAALREHGILPLDTTESA
jgi:hypothetical protein